MGNTGAVILRNRCPENEPERVVNAIRDKFETISVTL